MQIIGVLLWISYTFPMVWFVAVRQEECMFIVLHRVIYIFSFSLNLEFELNFFVNSEPFSSWNIKVYIPIGAFFFKIVNKCLGMTHLKKIDEHRFALKCEHSLLLQLLQKIFGIKSYVVVCYITNSVISMETYFDMHFGCGGSSIKLFL